MSYKAEPTRLKVLVKWMTRIVLWTVPFRD
jgi:hypothetical protein